MIICCLGKNKIPNNEIVLDIMVDAFVNETLLSINHFTSMSEFWTNNIRFTIKNRSGRYNMKQEDFLFQVVLLDAK